MATAKKHLTGDVVQGHHWDRLNELIELAASIADRAGLLHEDMTDLPSETNDAEADTLKRETA